MFGSWWSYSILRTYAHMHYYYPPHWRQKGPMRLVYARVSPAWPITSTRGAIWFTRLTGWCAGSRSTDRTGYRESIDVNRVRWALHKMKYLWISQPCKTLQNPGGELPKLSQTRNVTVWQVHLARKAALYVARTQPGMKWNCNQIIYTYI